jgi:UDP-N-acetylmuramyl pentapeptide synthase
MLELGADAAAIHRDAGRRLAERLDAIVGVGPLARQLVDGARDARGTAVEIHHFADSAAAAHAASTLVRHGDAVLVKGSRGIRLEAVVNALVAQLGKAEV